MVSKKDGKHEKDGKQRVDCKKYYIDSSHPFHFDIREGENQNQGEE
jgi:hypothetical protein